MAKRDHEIENIKEKMNNVEDDVFSSFCESIGISNIRQYEERELRYFFIFPKYLSIFFFIILINGNVFNRSQEERAKKRMEFENQCNRIQTQLDFEKQRDTESKSYYFKACCFANSYHKKIGW